MKHLSYKASRQKHSVFFPSSKPKLKVRTVCKEAAAVNWEANSAKVIRATMGGGGGNIMGNESSEAVVGFLSAHTVFTRR